MVGVDKLSLEGGMTLLVSGREDGIHYQGVGLLMGRSAGNALTEWESIDERLLYARFKSSHDYVMRKVAEETNAGIVWKDERKLVDLDYADDIVLINEGVDETQRVLDCLVREGKKVGLEINCPKTKIMNMNIVNAGDCLVEGKVVEQVERSWYSFV
ncbi:hypothetical protein Pmani_003672 [Petrolisthes manimaculis]|uniref:Reverse transcriptase domain-containing protein n=1 Tax=Petrolisthes manimaculis TaxID=1843537 RepID=A0AAE1UPR1_9EUCA|nr:hypothetical protein Pmani_003672 [Petrolisthes manimaculis]